MSIQLSEAAADCIDSTRYIVFDLEWNQSTEGKAGEMPGLPFEIIELGAVKLDETFHKIGEFSRFICPTVYKKLHFKVLEIMRVGMEELRNRGEPFPEVMEAFLSWCREGEARQPVFCTWGNMDLTELQRNMAYYGMENPFPYPLLYYDVQKLYNLLYKQNSKDKLPLDRAVQEMGLPAAGQFHRALDDARYTAGILQNMEFEAVRAYLSLDYYKLPESSEEEIYLVFPDYSKYVSRRFQSREEAIADKTVTDMLCYRCKRLLKKRVRWFTANQRNYYCLAWCPEHGFARGKIRMRRTAEGEIYCLKTIKLTDDDGVKALLGKKEAVLGKRRKKARQKRRKNGPGHQPEL